MFIEVLTSSKARNQDKRLQNETNPFVYFRQLSIMGLTFDRRFVYHVNLTLLSCILLPTDRSMGGTGPPKLNLVDNRRLF